MTTEMMIEKIESYNEWKELLEQAKMELASIETEIKDELEALGTEELEAGQYIVRNTSVLSNRFNSTEFKKAYAELYKEYLKPVSSRRFTISC